MPLTARADVARLIRLTQHFATEAVQAGDVAAFPPPAALAELPPVELRRLLDGLLNGSPLPGPSPTTTFARILTRCSPPRSPSAFSTPASPLRWPCRTCSSRTVSAGRWGRGSPYGGATSPRCGRRHRQRRHAEMLGCWVPGHTCIDNVIHAVAGPGLRAECAAYMEGRAGHPEETGRALLTNGYHLPAEHVIHTVGPIVEGEVTEKHRMLLASSYRSVLDLAAEAGLDSVGLCSVSTGASATPRRRLRRSCSRSSTGGWMRTPGPGRASSSAPSRRGDVDAYEKALIPYRRC